MLLLGDKTSFIWVLSLVRYKVLINGLLSPGDNNPVFGVLLLGDETSFMNRVLSLEDNNPVYGVLPERFIYF